MEPVLTPEEMRRADASCIAAGTSGFELMDRAAFACATVGLRLLRGGYGRRVVVVCGTGNNGGDGIAAAGYLASAGALVDVLLLDEPAGDAALHLKAALRRAPRGRLRVRTWAPSALERASRGADLVCDAVFGTGFSGEPRGDARTAIEAVAGCGRPVLAIDVPSGVSGGDGAVAGPAVRADVTVAIQALKPGHVLPPGTFRCGRVDVADVGIPIGPAGLFLPTAGDVTDVLPSREPDTNKYRVGGAAILAASDGMTGAAALAARGAIRSGAGIVFLGVPRSSLPVVEELVAEAVKVPLPDVEGQLDPKAVDEFADRLERSRALAVGPGIGRGPNAVELVRRCLDVQLPLVVDADGLTALAEILVQEPDVLGARAAPTVLTPHTGELARLLGREVRPDRLAEARDAAARWDAIVHVKGRRAITASPEGRAWVNPTGNPGMATAGTGDVLTGVITGLLAQGLPADAATWAGAFLQGLAGDVAAERAGERSVAAGDLADSLSAAFARLGWIPRTRGRLRTALEAT